MFFLFFLLLLLLSGKITVAVCLPGAVVAAAMTWFCRKYMGYDRQTLGSPWALVRYLGYLLVEMLKAGLVVMKLVYTQGRDTEPVLVYFHPSLTSKTAQVMLANSITLTAGTITVHMKDGTFGVHALDASLAEGIENSTFQRRLEQMEGSSWRK